MYKTKWVTAPLEQKSNEFSEISVNGPEMAKYIEHTCNIMEKDGYKLIGSPTPVTRGIGSGRYTALKNKSITGHVEQYGGGWGYGYGFSFTSGVMLLFHK